MATTKQSKLNALLTELSGGTPVSSGQLATMGISADLAVHYARTGWLKRLGRGVYCRPGEPLRLHPSLLLLQQRNPGLHVGGKTALEWHGVRQYVAQREMLHLFGWDEVRLPDWFTQTFPSEYHRKRLFNETPAQMHAVNVFESNGPLVSAPERALLELLDEVGIRQPLQEAKEITESTYNFRADTLMTLLKACKSVKTVRLCLQIGRELSMPWASKLDGSQLPKGSARPWVSKSKDGLLVLKA